MPEVNKWLVTVIGDFGRSRKSFGTFNSPVEASDLLIKNAWKPEKGMSFSFRKKDMEATIDPLEDVSGLEVRGYLRVWYSTGATDLYGPCSLDFANTFLMKMDYGENVERLSDTTWEASHFEVLISAEFVSERPKEYKDCFIMDQELMEEIISVQNLRS